MFSQKVKILGIQRSEYHPNELNNHKIEELIKKFNYKLEKKFKDINFKKATKVLYAPTHRDHLSLNYKNTLLEKIEGFNLEELNTFLKNENIFLFLREHAEAGLNSHIQNNNLKSNIFNLSAEEFPNLEKYLDFIDVLITDYSGIFIEHLKSKKSFAFALFDIEEYENKRGLILTKEVLFPGFIFRSQKKLIYFLKNREIIDQTYSHSIGMNGLYALALGKVVLGGSEPEALESLGIKNSPVINIKPNSQHIFEQIEILLRDINKIKEIGYLSRKYVENVHSHTGISKKFLDTWAENVKKN